MRGGGQSRSFRQVSREFQTLRFAARQRRHRLPEAKIFESDFGKRAQGAQDFGISGEVVDGFRNRHVEHIGNALCRLAIRRDRDFEQFRPIAAPIAVRAAQIHIGQELHLDVFESVAAAGWATTVAGIETEHAGFVGALFCHRRFREQIADRIEGTDVARGIRARSSTNRGLVHHDHVADQVRAGQRLVRTRRFGSLALVFEQCRIEYVLHQRGFARP